MLEMSTTWQIEFPLIDIKVKCGLIISLSQHLIILFQNLRRFLICAPHYHSSLLTPHF